MVFIDNKSANSHTSIAKPQVNKSPDLRIKTIFGDDIIKSQEI